MQEQFVTEGVGSRAQRRERRMRRRRLVRRVLALTAAVAVVVASAFVVLNLTDEHGVQVRADQATDVDSAATVGSSLSTTPKSSAPTTSTSTSTAPPKDVPAKLTATGFQLAEADMNAPVRPPVGQFKKDNKLYLTGSVPASATADAYYRKASDILGAPAVVVMFKRDPRAPAGPLRVVIEDPFDLPTGSGVVDLRFDTYFGVGNFVLQRVPEARLLVTAYTDDVGPADANKKLSETRAKEVVAYLVKKGIPADRIDGVGMGEADPVASNATPEGRERNRRVVGSIENITP